MDYKDFIAVFGTGALLASLIFVLTAFSNWIFIGGPFKNPKPVFGLGTAMGNSSGAFVVALANFSSQYSVRAMIIVVYMLSIIIIIISRDR
jgi:hypothetical protein